MVVMPLPPSAALSPKLVSLHDFSFGLLLAAAAILSSSLFPFMISLPEESMVSEHLRIRNKKLVLYEYFKNGTLLLWKLLFGVYAGVFLFCLWVIVNVQKLDFRIYAKV